MTVQKFHETIPVIEDSWMEIAGNCFEHMSYMSYGLNLGWGDLQGTI